MMNVVSQQPFEAEGTPPSPERVPPQKSKKQKSPEKLSRKDYEKKLLKLQTELCRPSSATFRTGSAKQALASLSFSKGAIRRAKAA
jgi:hypothetical protein